MVGIPSSRHVVNPGATSGHSKEDRMTATTAEPVSRQRGFPSSLVHRQLDSYPNTGPRVFYLALTVLATVMLYYELYVGGSVSTLVLTNLHMSFTFFVLTLAFGNLIGAFGSLFVGFIIPAATNKWTYTIEGFVVGVVEGICLVATPALIRDFSPQVGRATAMGFWTCGPVLGSLIVSVVGTNTIPAVIPSTRFWTHEYHICGIAGLFVFLIALLFLRELSPQLRDQLMVTMRDRALIEARAKGINIQEALQHPWRQLLKTDVVVSAIAVSVMLLIYYTAVGFLVIFMGTVFGIGLKDANGLGNWEWGFNVIALIGVGMLSDRLRVRKPFMVIGGILGAVMVVIYLMQIGHHPSYYTLAIILALLSVGLGIAYTPWMASYTETVEARNPALTATGLAIWGWIIRLVVCLSFFMIPVVINTVTPLVNYGSTVATYAKTYPSLVWAGSHGKIVADATKYATPLTFAATHPDIVALAEKDKTQIADAQKFAPQLAVIKANAALFTQAAKYTDPTKIPPALAAKLVKAAGGGSKGLAMLQSIAANKAAINGVIAALPDLTQLQPYAAQLTALAAVPAPVIAEVSAPGVGAELAAAAMARMWQRLPPRPATSGRRGTGSASVASSSSSSRSRSCVAAGVQVTPGAM